MSTPTTKPEFAIAIPLYDGVDLMDVAAPTELFASMNPYWADKQAKVYHVARTSKVVVTRDGTKLVPHKTFAQLPAADLLWTPGGDPEVLTRLMYTDAGKPYLNYLRKIAAKATWVTSVCEGALLIAQAGLLDGYKATTHWAFMNCLRDRFPKITVIDEDHPRYVIDRNRVTGAGISSGLDEALFIIQLLAGSAAAQSVQLFTQYYPKPPVTGTIPEAGTCPVSLKPAKPKKPAKKKS
jgi:transcriptional regulator GlxA family with amidase domain